jgi:hypothetical protein
MSSSNLSSTVGVRSPVDFTRTRNDYDDHSPLHHEEESEVFGTSGESIEDELQIVSEDLKIDNDTSKKNHRYEEAAFEECAGDYKEEYDDVFDESYMYNELAKMEVVKKLESVVSSTEILKTLPSEGDKKEEELDMLGRPMRLYSTPMSQPVYAVGKTQISHSQAKLFHLFDKNGEIDHEHIKNRSQDASEKNHDSNKYKKTFSRVKALATPREVDTSLIVVEEDRELTFQPVRSKQAGERKRCERKR